MTSARKVTVKPSDGKYKWTQTPEALSISLPVKNVLMKHIEILYTEICLKDNVQKLNYVQVIDFPHEIEFENPLNKVTLTDEGLEVYLIKVIPEAWSEL